MRRTFTAEEKASVFELWKNGTGFSEMDLPLYFQTPVIT